jgi:hypothetical protein
LLQFAYPTIGFTGKKPGSQVRIDEDLKIRFGCRLQIIGNQVRISAAFGEKQPLEPLRNRRI